MQNINKEDDLEEKLRKGFLSRNSSTSEESRSLPRHPRGVSFKENSGGSQGQALVLMMVVMALGLTIGSAIFINSLREYRVSTYQSQYSMAESAAEAGLEHGLGQQGGLEQAFEWGEPSGGGDSWGLGDYQYGIESSGTEGWYVSTKVVEENEVIEIRVGDVVYSGSPPSPPVASVAYKYNGDINIYWNGPTINIETLVYKIKYTVGSEEVYLDREILASTCGGGSTEIGDEEFACEDSVTIDGDDSDEQIDEIMRIRPIGGGTMIGIIADTDLPRAQAITVTSLGRSGQAYAELEEEVTRPFLPPIFDYLMFSGGNITKN